jgi:flagellar export protein FliJ
MQKFKFRLDSVKRVKEAFEKKAQKELAQIDLFIKKHEELKNKLVLEVNVLRNSGYNKKISVGELQFIGGYDTVLRNQIETEDRELNELARKRESKVNEVIIKTKEKKMLVQLEETHREKYERELVKSESKQFDEIAVRNFAKANK